MFQNKKSRLLMIAPIILIVMMITGCASKTAASATSGTGVVTESSMTDTVETSGSVNAKQLAVISWATSGTVQEVNVATNDQVKDGDTLMKLNSTTAPADVIQAISTLITAQQNLTNAKESNTSLAEAEVALNTAKDAYYKALGYSYTLGKPVGSEDYNAILRVNVINAQNAYDKAKDNYDGYSEASDSDTRKAEARATLAQATLDLKEATSIYNYYTSTPNAMDSATITGELNLAKAQLDDAQRAYDLIKNGDNSDAIASAQAAVDAAQATVNKLSIIAPFDGEVAVIYSQVGDVVSAGTEALALVDRSKLYVDVQVDETSIANIKVGNTADITFDSLNGLATTGKVTMIDPIGTATSGVVNYTVRVELDKSDPLILIGATATVVINIGEPQSVLFVPVSAVLNDAQGEYVMRLNNGATERVTVVSGQIVDQTVIVTGDLKKGDVVQLFTSTSSSSNSDTNARGGFSNGGGGEPPSGAIPVP
ncbi:efflux RND transporter periplasmic adaptor subunit [bacterium]|nr:efflux RND transporter periplasmic adaptor subunit [bacterium]